MNAQLRDFGRRVNRINRVHARTAARNLRRLRSGDMPWLLALAISLITGLIVGTFARITRFQLTGDLPFEGIAWGNLAMDFSLAFVSGVVLLQMIGIVGREHLLALMLGVFATAFAFHIPVHDYPAVYAALFSPDWVAAILGSTRPDTLAIF